MSLVLRPRRAAPVSAFPAFPPPDICAHQETTREQSKTVTAKYAAKFSSWKGAGNYTTARISQWHSATAKAEGGTVSCPLFLLDEDHGQLVTEFRSKKGMVTCSSPLRIFLGRGLLSL
jgi:hypothetical protein